MVAGHSLGGALAVLAAYDIQQAFGFRSFRVYTFGAPRVGNHPFAREYGDAVTNTWTVINDKVSCDLSDDTATHRHTCLASASLQSSNCPIWSTASWPDSPVTLHSGSLQSQNAHCV